MSVVVDGKLIEKVVTVARHGRESQRTDAVTGNERRPIVDRWNDGACSRCDDDERRQALIKYLKTIGLTHSVFKFYFLK